MPPVTSSFKHFELNVGPEPHHGPATSADDFATLAAKQSDSRLTTRLPREMHIEVLKEMSHETRSDFAQASKYWEKLVKVQRHTEESASVVEPQSGSRLTTSLPRKLQLEILGYLSPEDQRNLGKTGRYWFHLDTGEANKTMDQYELAGRLDPAHDEFAQVFSELPVGKINRKNPGRIDDLIEKIPGVPQDYPKTPTDRKRSPGGPISGATAIWSEYTRSQRATLFSYATDPTIIPHPPGRAAALMAIGVDVLPSLSPAKQREWAQAVMELPNSGPYFGVRAIVMGVCDVPALTEEVYDMFRQDALNMPPELRDKVIDRLEIGRRQLQLREMTLGLG